MTLFTFDIDGTLSNNTMNDYGEHVRGIIPTSVLIKLILDGHKVALVSPSPFYPEGFDNMVFAPNGSNEYRWENVREAMKWNNITSKDDVVYIDDLKANRENVRKWGIKQVYSPEEFMKEIGKVQKY